MALTQVVLHTHGGLGVAAHGVHYAILGAGVLGLVALLSPRFLAHPPSDEHERRVLALRDRLTDPGLATGSLAATTHDPTRVAVQQGWSNRAPELTTAERAWLPLAVVSSSAAAGVHAAMTPEHARETAAFGVFFAACALLQLIWAGAVAVACSRTLLLAGVLGNVGVLALWGVTRTIGLPLGLLPGPEAVGAWDLAAGAWELVLVCSCIALLQSTDQVPARMGDWRRWHAGLPTYVAASVLLLVALSVAASGA